MPASAEVLRRHASSDALDSTLRKLFIAYASFGDISNVSSLSSSKLSKLFKDAGLLSAGGLTSVDVDLAFVRVAQQAQRPSGATASASAAKKKQKTISYPQFLEVTYALAAKRSGDSRPSVPPSGRLGLLALIVEHLLPLGERGPGGSGGGGGV